MNSSDKSMVFGFNKTDADKNEQKTVGNIPPVEETVDVVDSSVSAENKEEDENDEYVDIRNVTIMLVKNYSLYQFSY